MAVFAFEVKVYAVALLCANVLAPVSGSTQGKTESKLVLAEGLATHWSMATHVSPITLYTQHIILSDNFLSCPSSRVFLLWWCIPAHYSRRIRDVELKGTYF